MDKSSDATVGVGLHGSRCGDAYALVVGATPCHISLKHLLRVTLDEFADYDGSKSAALISIRRSSTSLEMARCTMR